MDKDYYTLQITYNAASHKIGEVEVIEFKDIEGWNNVKDFQKSIWVSGIRLQTTPTAWELIAPFRINKAMVIKQPHKYKI